METDSRLARCLVTVAVAVAVAVPASATAAPPPVEVALEVVGEGAGERADDSWELTVVDDGPPVQVCGKQVGDAGWRFVGDETIEVTDQAEPPWSLAAAMLWSDSPAGSLLEIGSADFSDESGRVETFGDRPVFCWGEDSRLCVSEKLRRIVVVDVEVDGVDWGLWATGGGDHLHVAADGSHLARLSRTDGACR